MSTIIFTVSKVNRVKASRNVILHAFTNKKQAENFCINYLYEKSTLEDRTYNKIEKSEYDGGFIEYSLYTNEYGSIDLEIKETKLD